jgi:hypothetical protein
MWQITKSFSTLRIINSVHGTSGPAFSFGPKMCVIQKTHFICKECTLPDENHYGVKSRVITLENPDIDQDFIDKLVCNNPKKTSPLCTDPACDDLTE